MNKIYNIAESLIKLNGWRVLRLDIQRVENKTLDEFWYIGYLVIRTNDGDREELIIRDNGEFEIRD